MTIIIMTHSKKSKHAKKSWAKHNPERKYATLKTSKIKSDNFVLRECSESVIFIFGQEYK